MSYFLFGSFDSVYDKELLEQVKSYASERNVYMWFGEEITFYKEWNAAKSVDTVCGIICTAR